MQSMSEFWTYRVAEPTPVRQDLPPGTFKGTTAEWEGFSPGMRREIARTGAGKAKYQERRPVVAL